MGHVFLIAEAGVNHNGDIETAKKLIDAAVRAGADAVKFQTFRAENLVCKSAEKAAYQLETTDTAETQFEMLKKLELNEQEHWELMQYCQKRNIMFLSTPFDIDSLHYLINLGVGIIKIASGEITDYPLLREAGKTGKKVILSTGMSTLNEVREAVDVLKENGSGEITVLHCNTEYPTPVSDVNLLAMVNMREELGLPTGYSDHTQGIEIPIAAAVLGATVIEKHFTLDKTMAGPDHRASLEPDELQVMVRTIRNIEGALGNGIKAPSESEKRNVEAARKSIVVAADIKKGEKFTEKNLTTKRPGTGINPMRWDEVMGKKAERDYKADEMLWL